MGKIWMHLEVSLTILLMFVVACRPHAIAFKWVPYVPPEDTVELYHWVLNGVSYVNVSITFPHVNFNVSDWGDPIIIGNSISVDAGIWEYTGPSIPVTITIQHTYELGTLSPGEYIFTFMAWGQTVKSITFKLAHDIAIINVWPYKRIVGQGFIALIMVNVTNEGDFAEIFNLTVFEGLEPAPILIERWHDPNGNLSDKFWRNYGDTNRDGYIDCYDAYMVHLNSGWMGPPGKNPADVTCDGVVDIWDLLKVVGNAGNNIWDCFGLEKIIQEYAVVSLNSTDYEIIGFRWNTTGYAKGNYTIRAYAWPVQGEIDIDDNAFVDGQVYIGIPGDINADGTVDVFDAVLLSAAAGSTPCRPYWNPNADINDDCIVDVFDAVILAAHAGETDP